MFKTFISIISTFFLLMGLVLSPITSIAEASSAEHSIQLPKARFSSYFTENKGQWDAAILWAGKTAEGQVAVTHEGIYLQHFSKGTPSNYPLPLSMMNSVYPSMDSVRVEQEFIPFQLSPDANFIPQQPLHHVHHYFTGNDPSRWATHCRNFGRLRIEDQANEKDLILHFDDQKFMTTMAFPAHSKEDEASSNVHYIMEYSMVIGGSGMDVGAMKLDKKGYPVIAGNTSSADFMLDDPEDEREEFKGEMMPFAMKVAPRGHIEFITFVGGSDIDAMINFHLTEQDHIVMSGITMSYDFPEINAFEDMGMMLFVGGFVAVLNANGDELLNSSYFMASDSFMTMITSQCLDQEGHLLFSSVIMGTEGFEHDHALIEETDDELISMMGLYLIEVDLEAFTINRRILADYGMHLIIIMEISQDDHLFMTGISINLDGIMMEDLISLYAKVIDPARENIVVSFNISDDATHLISAAQWKNPTTLVGISFEFPDLSSMMQEPGPSMEEDVLFIETYLFSYDLEEETLQTYTIGSEEDSYMLNKLFFINDDELWLTGSIISNDYDILLPFIEPCEDELDYSQAVILKLDSETMEIQYSLVLGGTGYVGANDIAFGAEDSIYIAGISSRNLLSVLETDPVFGEDFTLSIDTFLVKLVPGAEDLNPPEITLDLDPLSFTHEETMEISGKVVDHESGVRAVSLNDEPVSLDREGHFNLTLTLEEGSNLFEIKAWDLYQNEASKKFEIVYDPNEPLIELISPSKGHITTQPAQTLQFKVNNEISPIDWVSVAVDGEVQHETGEACPEEGYIVTIELEKGENVVLITAVTMAGLQSELEFSLWRGTMKSIVLQIGNQQALIITDGEREEYELDVPPMIIESRTFVPVRFIAEGFGAEVGWDASDSSITITFEGKRLVLWIGLDYAMLIQEKDGQRITQTLEMDVAPVIMNARTLVPLRFIAEAFGAEVEWDAATQGITIKMITLP